mgnify:CR=1
EHRFATFSTQHAAFKRCVTRFAQFS